MSRNDSLTTSSTISDADSDGGALIVPNVDQDTMHSVKNEGNVDKKSNLKVDKSALLVRIIILFYFYVYIYFFSFFSCNNL